MTDFTAQIIEDSATLGGTRLTTMQLRYPRFIHAELMTHRVFSRNASSSRAIPVKRMIEEAEQRWAEPIYWGKNQPGMQAKEELSPEDREIARMKWNDARYAAIAVAEQMAMLGMHKQIVNRILEPFIHINVVVTATEWTNWFDLRNHPDAQPEIQELAKNMDLAMRTSTPVMRDLHLPYVSYEERAVWPRYELMNLAAARCARVSYLTHEGKEPEFQADMELAQKLWEPPPHLSPFEHAATPADPKLWYGNFKGWRSARHHGTMDTVLKEVSVAPGHALS